MGTDYFEEYTERGLIIFEIEAKRVVDREVARWIESDYLFVEDLDQVIKERYERHSASGHS